ncbi:MAG: winged helix-turn-helix domain-containing protein [Serratia marcescens]|uniref:transcriptional regulator n=1 Tax=Serratia TaxID=613 RepID=UPI001E61F95C|nr:helix-turn-helix domain-containing protein [Serratia marcescens]MBN5261957.1 winged helix-turn-helix domain-containing protein [Serratia marcescens]MBN5293598.1 winged helix-turn-helix domain-containing protein [Serratia marcescens]MDU3571810.1 winged helix-turn-helix domain-containing protein [Serratia marcescens]MDU3646583.1 winged helix-turn-helix domain-containing protein [Serratia marcescens]CAI1526368.1 Transcriptional regulatory protein, C terminal [Serratia marcescens]
MKYIIDKFVIFDSNSLTLHLYDNSQVTTRLTKPATRLLLELIQNNRTSMARDDLFKKVWLTHGFTASNAGLNNYISELRKAFSLLGHDREIIITIPKLGFRLEAVIDLFDSNIEPSGAANAADEQGSSENNDAPLETTPEDQSIPERSPSFLHQKVIIFSATIILGIIVAVVILKMTNQDNYPYQKIATLDQCEIYGLGKLQHNLNNELTVRISGLLKHEEVDCKNIPSDVFYLEDRITTNSVRADLVSVCSKTGSHHYDTCFNIKSQRNTSK